MPYPLSKLPYGLCDRLRELATPREVYALQVAAPHLAGLQPIQKVKNIDNVRIQFRYGNLGAFFDHSDNEAFDGTLFRFNKKVTFTHLNVLADFDDIFGTFVFNVTHVVFYGGIICLGIIQKIAKNNDGTVKHVKFENCQIDADVTSDSVAAAFGNVVISSSGDNNRNISRRKRKLK